MTTQSPAGDTSQNGELALAVPPGMTPEKLEKIADFVSILDRMDIDLDQRVVTFKAPVPEGCEMQDDLRSWADHIRAAAAAGRDSSPPGSLTEWLIAEDGRDTAGGEQ